MKTCFKCGETRSLFDFHKHSGMKDGRLNKCKSCVVKDVEEWRQHNPEARKKEHAKKREKLGKMTKEQYLNKRKQNKIGRKASALKYSYKRRRVSEKMFMNEFDEFVFEEASKLCQMREKTTGIKWHIDHIVPMFHKQACGLNTASNFQVVPASWNVKKGNRSMETYFNVSGY